MINHHHRRRRRRRHHHHLHHHKQQQQHHHHDHFFFKTLGSKRAENLFRRVHVRSRADPGSATAVSFHDLKPRLPFPFPRFIPRDEIIVWS